ncbi:Flavin-containing monooxygenase FMO GS-OX5 [Hordeum vulgare]|nr:Flavin-containing monooxygenase FMO GS-OX5 [Hordeum vulgare]
MNNLFVVAVDDIMHDNKDITLRKNGYIFWSFLSAWFMCRSHISQQYTLLEIFFGLQSARKESRSADAAVLEEQVQRRLPHILPRGGPTISRSRVAVIGARAAGLVAARELLREGHAPVVVFERAAAVGGTWRYDDAASADPLGAGGVHGSLYASLRTNPAPRVHGLPRLPLPPCPRRSAKVPRPPADAPVSRGLRAAFDLLRLVRLETEVVGVRRTGASSWTVSYRSSKLAGPSCDRLEEEVFDAVVVCNGHFTEPRLADIPRNCSIHLT